MSCEPVCESGTWEGAKAQSVGAWWYTLVVWLERMFAWATWSEPQELLLIEPGDQR